MRKEIGFYRVEFKEDSQNWHLDNGSAEPNTFGWFTVIEHCNDFYFRFFETYIQRKSKPYKKKYLLECAQEVEMLFTKLEYRQIQISFDWIKKES